MLISKIPRIIKYIIIGLLLGIIIGCGYYFLDYQNKTEEEMPVGVSKEKVFLADENQYDLDVVLNSIISNQIVLQNLIKSSDERIILLEDKLKEQKNDDNQSE